MANVTEGLTRVAAAIVTARTQRSELAIEIKNVTTRRRGEVRSLLASSRASRGRAHRAQRAQAEKAVRARHGEIHSLLQEMKVSRGRAARDYRKQAIAANSGRRREVKALLAWFLHERIAQRKHRQAVAAAQRREAAAFMRDLTRGVAALRHDFVKMARDRAAAVHVRLGAYALDRLEAVAIWRGTSPHGRQAVSAHSSAPRHEGGAPSHDTGARPGKRILGNSSHRGSSERYGEDMK